MLPVSQFSEFVTQNRLFNSGSVVLAAVSGGMDSVLMARLLAASGQAFAIAHCNFQLRGAEADADQAFCRDLATEMNAPFHTINFDTTAFAARHKLSIQMAARQLRYQWFDELRLQNHYCTIALAHHQNDAIETILLNLTRGTGITGLHGILPQNGHLTRPLLFLGRDEIESIVSKNNIPYREDSSNSSTKYARNLIRHEVIPKLKTLNPSLERTFEHNLQHFRQLEQLLEQETDKYRQQLIIHGDELHLPLAVIRQLSPQHLLLFSLLQPYGFNRENVDRIITSLDKHSGRTFNSATHNLLLDRDKLILTENRIKEHASLTIAADAHLLNYGAFRLSVLHDDSPLVIRDNPMATSVDTDRLIYPLLMRPWQQGDTFQPLGMKGRQLLSDFFIQQKLPLHQKEQVPVLINGNGDIIWLGGYRLDDRYKVSAKTKKVTIFELNNTL
ncbi:tRNA lysidine(34) synthetase TilS [Mucilaginibacter myungsuensis]|uniref:tRNA(Ile)-lysidine synthase n=1 Tax=Mucilaginibacter myungsuensis TaxID=649104 RepID=A0A929KYN5_9SPHI|nr:tRNA lysidine(34) synthetase TilS [Mucilaginibacter myungsuensis]MBE9661304.1 tRNA lysidine(34) synthetase TilS [Mucilaginibacter myungsuensis]MDN3597447.1 tRNA lysidine(34) synthetase TilS [Mucilaginibacter myungsuensis]